LAVIRRRYLLSVCCTPLIRVGLDYFRSCGRGTLSIPQAIPAGLRIVRTEEGALEDRTRE